MEPPFVVRFEPEGTTLLDEFLTCRLIFQKVGLLQLFEIFQGHNVAVTKAFAETFNGRTTTSWRRENLFDKKITLRNHRARKNRGKLV
jgi:hypothetical protein